MQRAKEGEVNDLAKNNITITHQMHKFKMKKMMKLTGLVGSEDGVAVVGFGVDPIVGMGDGGGVGAAAGPHPALPPFH